MGHAELGVLSPEQLEYLRSRAAARVPLKPPEKPNVGAGLALILVPSFATVGLGLFFEWGAGITALSAGGVGLAMAGLGMWLGWVKRV